MMECKSLQICSFGVLGEIWAIFNLLGVPMLNLAKSWEALLVSTWVARCANFELYLT